MPYILSPEQKVVVDALLCKEASSTKYFDIISAMQSICEACTLALGKGKNVLIHAPDAHTRQLLKSIFETIGLIDLSIDLSENNAIPEVDLIKLRSTLKKQPNTDAIINFELSKKRASTLETSISSFYEALDEKVLGGISFRDFAAKSIYKKLKASTLQTNISISHLDLDYSAAEYYHAKKEISAASHIYHKQYELYDHLSLFREDLWSDITESTTQKVKEQLNSFKQESTSLVSEFTSAIKTLKKDSNQKTSNTLENLESRFLLHEEACIVHGINKSTNSDAKEGLFSIFKKKDIQTSNKIYVDAFDDLSGIIKNISQEWYDELDTPTSEMISYDYILEFIETNRAKVSHYKEKINKNLNASIQRINKINTSSQEVISLDLKLKALIQKMNESELFDINLEHNILSFVKQLELSKSICDYIGKCHILVHSSSSYLEWKSFYNSTGKIFRAIFDQLKFLPKKEWIGSFEYWYEQQIHHHILDQKTISNPTLEAYFAQTILSKQFEISSLIANLHSQRIAGAELLKSTSKELYSTLFKKKQLPGTSWKDTSLMSRPFMQSFFPIHISDVSAYSAEYDIVISFSKGEDGEKTKLHYFAPIESIDIQNIADKKVNFLYLNDYNYTGSLAQLSSTDKLKASKKLAKYILSLNHNIKIYQLKNANIISLLPNHDDSYLEQALDQINVKVIDTTGVLYDRLTESILFTERKPYLIIKDGLINSELHEHALWQLKMIQLFKEVGYEIISLNTIDQLEDNEGQFNRILKKISGTFSDTEDAPIPESNAIETIAEEA